MLLDPKDRVARYRYGRVLQAKKDDTGALAAFEAAIRAAHDCPPPIVAAAYLEAARLHERLARRAQAIDYYRLASTLFGGGADTRAAANRALVRLRAAKSIASAATGASARGDLIYRSAQLDPKLHFRACGFLTFAILCA